MRRKLALVAFLVLVGGITFSQPFVKNLPVMAGMDSVTFSVTNFQDNGELFTDLHGTYAVPARCFKSVELRLDVDTTYIGEVLLEPVGMKDSHMYSFSGYLYKGKFSACTSMRELLRSDQCLSIIRTGECATNKFWAVRIRQAPTPFR